MAFPPHLPYKVNYNMQVNYALMGGDSKDFMKSNVFLFLIFEEILYHTSQLIRQNSIWHHCFIKYQQYKRGKKKFCCIKKRGNET